MWISPRHARFALGLAITLAAGTEVAHAGDPGELFPNVKPYDETVVAPISRPDRVIRPVTPKVEPKQEPKEEEETPEETPPSIPVEPPEPKVPSVKPRRPSTEKPPIAMTQPTAAPKVDKDLRFHPYFEAINKPLMDAVDQEVFEKEYADKITRALAGRVEDRRKLSKELAEAAAGTKSEKLKRFLMLHAVGMSIRGGAPLEERAARANAVLPLLNERTLAVTQAKADCLNDLILSASTSPTDLMLDITADAFATLARMQVQAGFPKDAEESLKKARESFNKCREKAPGRAEQVAEAGAWATRSVMASGMWPKWQQMLRTNAEDAFANNQCALLHLALYANVEQAGIFAARSDRKDLQKLAGVIKETYASEATRKDPLQVYALSLAIAEVSRTSAAHPFDKFSLAMLAGNKIELLMDSGKLPADKMSEARKQLEALREQVEKGSIKPGEPGKWLGGNGPVDVKVKIDEAKAKTVVTLGDLLKECPKELWPKRPDGERMVYDTKAMNEWLTKNATGRKIAMEARASNMGEVVVRADGSKYIPVEFRLPNKMEIAGSVVQVGIESRLPPAVAERAGYLQYGEAAKIGGTVVSMRLTLYRDYGYMRIILGDKAD